MSASQEVKSLLSSVSRERYSDQPVEIKCEVCGSKDIFILEYPDTRSFYFANMTLVSCTGCGISYVPNRPKGLDIYYQEIYSLDKGRKVDVSPEELFAGGHERTLALKRSLQHIGILKNRSKTIQDLLDVGAGYGMTLKTSEAPRKVAVEIDRSMDRYLQYVGAEVHRSFDTIPDANVDAVVCSHYLEHVYIKDIGENIRQMLRVLRPGGVALIEVPNVPLLRVDFMRARHAPHIVFFTLQSMRQIIEEAGGLVELALIHGLPRPLRPEIHYLPSDPQQETGGAVRFLFSHA